MSLWPRWTKNVAWLVVGEVLVKGALFLIAVLVARRLGTAAMGIFTVASGAALIAIPCLALGQVELLIRESARRPARSRDLLAASRHLARRFHLLVLPLAGVGLLLVPDADLRWALLAFLFHAVLRVAVMIRSAVFKGRDEMDVEVKARAIELATALTLLAVLLHLAAPVWTVGAALAVGAALGLTWLIRRCRDLPGTSFAAASDRSMIDRGELWREGLPFLGISLLLQVELRHDALVMASVGVAKAEIGLYGAAVVPTWGLLALPQLVAIALYPTFSRQAAAGTPAARAGLIAAGAGLLLGGGAGLLLWALREPLLELVFGADYLAAGNVLGRLAWALPGAGVAMLMGVVHAAWRRQHWVLAVATGVTLLAVGLNLYWIPRLGALGAASVAVTIHSLHGVLLFALGWAIPETRSTRESSA